MTRIALCFLALLTAALTPAVAQVQLFPYFTDGVVLQRDTTIAVWGSASPNSQVVVDLAGVRDTTTADALGAWRAELPPQPAGGPYLMDIESDGFTVSLGEVYIGDVWLAAGQSNMEWRMRQSAKGLAEAQVANDPLMRQFYIPKSFSATPETSLPNGTGWTSATTPFETERFSAVAYYTAKELRASLGIPIGIINASFGGSRIEEWMTASMLNGNGMGGPRPPTEAWNQMIHPILDLPLRGIMWYQGEANTTTKQDAEAYGDLFLSMISGWRSAFGQPTAPFIWVQLPNYGSPQTVNTTASPPSNIKWPILRGQQSRGLTLPNTGQVVTIDTGELDQDGKVDIHPEDKEPVGIRMALKIREVAYGENLVSGGPRYSSNQRRPDGSIAIDFTDPGSGLVNADGTLNGFAVRSQNGNFRWADAVLVGDQVIVSSPVVSEPRAVRYAWQYNPGVADSSGSADLYNAEGFPTEPFDVLVDVRLSGTYTVGGPGADYPDLASVESDLSAFGIRDSVVFLLQDGTHSERLELGHIQGATDTTRVVFGAADGAVPVLAPTATNGTENYIIALNGADYVTLSGLTFEPGGTDFENAIVLRDTLDGVEINNNVFLATGTGQTDRSAISTQDATTVLTDLVIRDNTISGFATGVSILAESSSPSAGTAIVGNTISNVSSGLRLDSQQAAQILANRVIATDSGMVLDSLSGETRLERNSIDGGGTGILIRDSNGSPGARPLAGNNMVITRHNAGAAFSIADSDHWRLWHNTISGGTSAAATGLNVGAGTGLSILNNILGSRSEGPAITVTASSLTDFESDYNALASGGSVIGRIDGVEYSVFSQLKAALDALDATGTEAAYSRQVSPIFADTTSGDLRLDGVSPGDPLLEVVQLPDLLTDIDGDARGASTYAGADDAGVAFFDRVVLNGPAGWRMLSLPYPDLGLGGSDPGGAVTPGLLEPLYTAGYPGADIDEDGTGGYATVFLFDETETSGVPNAEYGPPVANMLAPGQGFWYYMFQDEDPFTNGEQGVFPKVLPASGTPLTTDYSFSVTYTPNGVIPGANLLGNPYNEGLDWGAPGWTRSNVITTVYVYDPTLGPFGDYRQWTAGLGGTLTNGVIPVAQGFFTYAIGSNPQLIAPASARTGFWTQAHGLTSPRSHSAPEASKSDDRVPHIRFEMTADLGDREHLAFAAVTVDKDASLGLDAQDAYALEPASGVNALRLVAAIPGSEAGASGLSVISVPGAAEIPLHAEAFASGQPTAATARLSWQPLKVKDWNAILTDRATGERYSLAEAGEIEVMLEGNSALMPFASFGTAEKNAARGNGLPTTKPVRLASTTGSRFVVTLSHATTAGEASGAHELALHAPMPNPTQGALRVPFSLDSAQQAEVSVYDALGRRVAILADGPLAAGPHDLTMDASALAPGLYIVRLNTSETTLTQRFTVVR